MHIWNYAEGDLNGYAWSAMGLRRVTIQYTAVGGGGTNGAWGSDSPADWVAFTNYPGGVDAENTGELDVYDPGQPRSPGDVRSR